VPLTNQDTSVVDALCETKLVNAGLEAPLQEIFDLKGEHIIEFHAGFIKHTNTDETANKGIAFKEALGVFLVESKKLTDYSVSEGYHDLR
jgi:hypothetical protein